MLLPNVALPSNALAKLGKYQAIVDAEADYVNRVASAKRIFRTRNRRGNRTFDIVKVALTAMCSGARRCAYCEDSAADEVEHVLPKDFYPELTFEWMNYIYACGPCNSPKGNACAVLTAPNTLTRVSRIPHGPVLPPPAGAPGLIDPRRENALDFMILELRDTFWFVPSARAGTAEYERAKYTIDTLRLNSRDFLPKSRRAAYLDYRAHLVQYRTAKQGGGTTDDLLRLAAEIRSRQHPTVWFEMKRQGARLPDLAPLFADVPEALAW